MNCKFLVIVLFITAFCKAYNYDANDFAFECTNYVEGTGVFADRLVPTEKFNHPETALGRPTQQTTGDGWFIPPGQSCPVVPVYPAFRYFEVVTLGSGGSITLKFNHPVANDRNNLYGIDFIIFGNACYSLGSKQTWTNGNPENTVVSSMFVDEPGIVSVSQDGVNWYYYGSPKADIFAPTAGYQWDDVNNVWAGELNPTKPVNPELTKASFYGSSIAAIIDAYDGAAGGTGFDINDVGLDWIMYVRIEDDAASTVLTDIDAVADVAACGDYKHPFPAGDLNFDCRVNFADFSVMAGNWLDCTWECK
ncbi:MAG: hypothetical protein LLF92_02660 [Planctomycetaceae bacterium]|nr:hypothetical protein [Planctomycetaceae bacterium]